MQLLLPIDIHLLGGAGRWWGWSKHMAHAIKARCLLALISLLMLSSRLPPRTQLLADCESLSGARSSGVADHEASLLAFFPGPLDLIRNVPTFQRSKVATALARECSPALGSGGSLVSVSSRAQLLRNLMAPLVVPALLSVLRQLPLFLTPVGARQPLSNYCAFVIHRALHVIALLVGASSGRCLGAEGVLCLRHLVASGAARRAMGDLGVDEAEKMVVGTAAVAARTPADKPGLLNDLLRAAAAKSRAGSDARRALAALREISNGVNGWRLGGDEAGIEDDSAVGEAGAGAGASGAAAAARRQGKNSRGKKPLPSPVAVSAEELEVRRARAETAAAALLAEEEAEAAAAVAAIASVAAAPSRKKRRSKRPAAAAVAEKGGGSSGVAAGAIRDAEAIAAASSSSRTLAAATAAPATARIAVPASTAVAEPPPPPPALPASSLLQEPATGSTGDSPLTYGSIPLFLLPYVAAASSSFGAGSRSGVSSAAPPPAVGSAAAASAADDDDDSGCCCVCLDAPRTHVLVPCGARGSRCVRFACSILILDCTRLLCCMYGPCEQPPTA